MASEFSKFKDYVGDADKGLYSEKVGFEDELRWDGAANVVVSVVSARTGRSTNKASQNIGRPYFSATMRIVRINSKDEGSQLYEGALVGHFNWLPRDADPSLMSAADGFNLREALGFGDAVLGFEQGSIIIPEMEQLMADDGARMLGRKFGVRVVASKSKDGGRTFYNPSWYTVDENGDPKVPMTTETVRALRAQSNA